VCLHVFLTSALDECYWSVSRPGQLRYVLDKKAGWVSADLDAAEKRKACQYSNPKPPVVRPIGKSGAAGSCRTEAGQRDCQGGIWGFQKDTVKDQESSMVECGSRVAGFVFPDVSNERIAFALRVEVTSALEDNCTASFLIVHKL